MSLTRIMVGLLVAALALPVLLCVLLATAWLLAAMDDVAGAAAMRRVALAAYVVWAVDLIALVVLLAIETLNRRPRDDEG